MPELNKYDKLYTYLAKELYKILNLVIPTKILPNG